MKPFIPFFFLAVIAPAQVVSVGIKAGVPVTQALPYYQSNSTGMLDTGRWTVGPTIEFKLLKGFSMEADALYRGYRVYQSFVSSEFIIPAGAGMTNGTTLPAIYSSYFAKTKVWDLPVLLKYRIGSQQRYRPFLDAGVTFSHASTDVISSASCLSSADVCASSNYPNFYSSGSSVYSGSTNSTGPTAGAGVEFKIGKFKLAPEVRYTHYHSPTRKMATVMIGFTY